MKKLAKKINLLIVLLLLSYITIGTSTTVLATDSIKEEQIEKDLKDTSKGEEKTNNSNALLESESLNTKEESINDLEKNEKEILLEEQKDNETLNNDTEEETGIQEVEKKKTIQQETEEPASSEGDIEINREQDNVKEESLEGNTEKEEMPSTVEPEAESLSEEVSKGINEDGYVYSLQKNRELAMQIMEEDLAQKNGPQLFSRRAYVPSHVTAFIEKFAPFAVKYANQNGLYPSVMLAQAALESGWGGSSLSQPPYHQLFGIKEGNYSGKVITVPTQEWVVDKSHPNGGYMITIMDEFRVYDSFEESFKDQSNFLMKSRYTNVRRENAPTYQHATQALSNAGYATDPNYASKLNNIIQSYDLHQYDEIPTISYSSHVQSKGWLPKVNNGSASGTTNQAKRMEAIKIAIEGYEDLGITYSTQVQSKGWTDWVSDGTISGTTGEEKRIEAIKIKLTGKQADAFNVFYRVHVEGKGWLDWAENGSPSGTMGYGNRVEAISIMVKPKGYESPTSTSLDSYYEKPESISYVTHVQKDGWQNRVYDGETSGTIGQKKRLEAIKISLNNSIYDGSVQYKSHVQDKGWQNWVNEGQLSGTEGQAKRLEAIQIKLNGQIAEVYDIYYRTHVESYGWLGWAKNGASSGSEGLAKQVEAVEVQLVKKGTSAPGSTTNTFIKK